jgi:hypothetical protein
MNNVIDLVTYREELKNKKENPDNLVDAIQSLIQRLRDNNPILQRVKP